jgi:tetratricopeptide (TPR) repeat protein
LSNPDAASISAVSMTHHLEKAGELLRLDRLPEAERELKSVLQEDPNHEPGLILMGAVYLRMGKIAESERSLYQVLRIKPKNVDAIRWLARLRKAQRDFASAIGQFERAVQIGGDSAELQNEIGLCKQEAGDPLGAAKCFERATDLNPQSVYGYFNLGMLAKLRGDRRQAFDAFKRAAELDPTFLNTYPEIAELMQGLFNFAEALPILEAGLNENPDSLTLMVAVAATYRKVGQPERAEMLFQKAFAKDPDAGAAYAFWLQEEGRFPESIEVLEKWIRLRPAQGHAYYLLANQRCYEIDGTSLTETMTPLLEKRSLSELSRMYLAYGLAKTYDHEKNYGQAMKFFDEANALAFKIHRPRLKFDLKAMDATLGLLGRVFTSENIAFHSQYGSTSEAPLMIVGMIRTGTTLLDQILSSHPDVKSAGEQPFWMNEGWKTFRRWDQSGIKPDEIKQLADSYLATLSRAVGTSYRITDKMPTNSEYLGLISMVLPRAKFIHLRRNPVDTCLSIYTTYFGGGPTMFAYSQNNIVTAYKGYMRTMEYWRTVLPKGQMLEIDYEELVGDKETVLRRVLKFCGLTWNDAVLTHEENQSSVSTPSYWTARQPVNAGSVERWRRYEPWLGQLKDLRGLEHPKI